MHRDSYVRTSSSLYTLDNLGDQSVHLTNDAIQCHADSYGSFEECNKLTMADLQAQLGPDVKVRLLLVLLAHIVATLDTLASRGIKGCIWVASGLQQVFRQYTLATVRQRSMKPRAAAHARLDNSPAEANVFRLHCLPAEQHSSALTQWGPRRHLCRIQKHIDRAIMLHADQALPVDRWTRSSCPRCSSARGTP